MSIKINVRYGDGSILPRVVFNETGAMVSVRINEVDYDLVEVVRNNNELPAGGKSKRMVKLPLIVSTAWQGRCVLLPIVAGFPFSRSGLKEIISGPAFWSSLIVSP